MEQEVLSFPSDYVRLAEGATKHSSLNFGSLDRALCSLADLDRSLTLSLLMSYIYMELLVKPEILTSYINGLTFGNVERRLFLFAAHCFNTESMQKIILWHCCV
jgi:hypothetical protein